MVHHHFVVEGVRGVFAPDAPRLEIVNANDRAWSDDEYRRRKREFKICSGNGVYLLFNAEEQLRYVGAAMNTFDDRIWGHDADVNRHWTDVIPFPTGWYFLAPALEFFLIVKLQPPDNTVYRAYTIGERGAAVPEVGSAKPDTAVDGSRADA